MVEEKTADMTDFMSLEQLREKPMSVRYASQISFDELSPGLAPGNQGNRVHTEGDCDEVSSLFLESEADREGVTH